MAPNRPGPQSPRRFTGTDEDYPAVYSNVDDLRFGATPGGYAGAQPGYVTTGLPHPTVPTPRAARYADRSSHWAAPAPTAGFAESPVEPALSHPSDSWQQPLATGQWEVPGGRQGTAAPSDATGEWRFPQAMGPQQAGGDTHTGQWHTRTGHQEHSAYAAHPAQDTGQWDTGQWDTGQWDTAGWDVVRPGAAPRNAAQAAAMGETGAWEHGRVADQGIDATGEWRTGTFAAMGADTHGHMNADTDADAAMTDTAAWDTPFTDAGPSGCDDDWDQAAEDTGEGEWNPTADSVLPVRGRHRVMKRSGLARSSTVLGVGVIAAVGAGGIASAQGGKPPVHISVPDLSSMAGKLPNAASSIPVVGHLLAGEGTQSGAASTPLTSAGVTADDVKHGTTDPGEALRDRILQQAEQQQEQATHTDMQSAEDAAVKKAADEADRQREEAKKKAAAKKKEAEEAAKRKAEAERLAKLAKSFTLPVSSYTLTSHFGDPGAMWSSGYHTGLDFAAPTGTPLKAIHSGTVKEAGWSGSYGYRTVIELSDGTELWFCHQSSISVSVGQKVTTGQVIGRVGATGNVTGPHLHLEVHPGGGAAIDPLPWLQGRGLQP